ncbi:hypothetical protein GCM10011386_47870 [Parapedobacter defluvii]|uniref:DUF4832 domain-containing protein n=2 Tax=Parapedobacter defluvii TaxID=2045106 RepID=A0ABQ1MZD5_9SPHI|nr:hypothetical protein GCM10011386_47870 [Parapedobacter defluvii]
MPEITFFGRNPTKGLDLPSVLKISKKNQMKAKLTSLVLVFCWVASEVNAQAPLVLQSLDYTENPVDIPNPDRGPYRGRWQRVATHFGTTPEVDHLVPVDAHDVLFHGATLVGLATLGTVEGDDIEETQFFNGQNISPNYAGGTGVSALPSISFMGFDLARFSSNAFLSATGALAYQADGLFEDPVSGAPRTGKTQPLTNYALDYIRGLLQKVRDGNGVAFVKFSYDGNGFNYLEPSRYPHLNLREGLIHGPEPAYVTPNNPSAMCDVPGYTDKDWIEYHLWQLKPIFHEFEDIIMCVKTGMLGPWGEQHSSPMALDPEANKKLFDTFLDVVPDSRLLLTTQRVFLSWYNLTYGTTYTVIDSIPVPPKGSPEARWGYFDDSYGSNYTNSGRYRTPDDRYRFFNWIHSQNTMTQIEGGIGDNIFGHMPGAILEAQQFRITAANMRHGNYSRWSDFIYNEANVTTPVTFPASASETSPPFTGPTKTAIFDPVYDGRNGLEYMRDRFGYRLVLREAKASEWVERRGTLAFEGKIQNVGFGNILNRKNVSVILKSKAGSNAYIARTDLDARDWLADEGGNGRPDNTAAWRDLNFSVAMSTLGDVPAGNYDIYLKINDPKEKSTNKRCIRFANKGNSWNADLGANLIGSTTVR